MLRRCWASKDDAAEGAEVRVNCFINSSCCADGRIRDIDVTDAADTDADKDRGEAIETDILRSESPSRPSVRRCLGCCGANSEEKGAAVADETIDLHVAS